MAYRVIIVHPEQQFSGALQKVLDDHGYDVAMIEAQEAASGALAGALEQQSVNLLVVTGLMLPAGVPEQVARLSQRYELPLIVLSSHKVFEEGPPDEALLEDHTPTPNAPESVALLAEEQAFLQHTKAAVVRLPWVVDDVQAPALYNLCEALITERKLMVSDQWRGNPVDVKDVVRVVFAMLQQMLCGAENWGVFHLRSNDDCSEAEFADYVRRLLLKAGCQNLAEIAAVRADHRLMQYHSWLGGHRLTNDFGVQLRSWRQGMKTKVVEWLSEQVDKGRLELPPDRPSGP